MSLASHRGCLASALMSDQGAAWRVDQSMSGIVSVFCCMKCLLLLVSLMETSALAQNFQTIDRVDGWLIECKVNREQNHVCRASLPDGGSWFSARVRLDLNDALGVPKGLTTPNTASVDSARKALHLCRSSLLYF